MCTIIVTIHHVILYLVKCLLLRPLYSVHCIVQHVPILAVFIAVSAVSVLVFFTFIETPPLAHAQKINHAPDKAKENGGGDGG